MSKKIAELSLHTGRALWCPLLLQMKLCVLVASALALLPNLSFSSMLTTADTHGFSYHCPKAKQIAKVSDRVSLGSWGVLKYSHALTDLTPLAVSSKGTGRAKQGPVCNCSLLQTARKPQLPTPRDTLLPHCQPIPPLYQAPAPGPHGPINHPLPAGGTSELSPASG